MPRPSRVAKKPVVVVGAAVKEKTTVVAKKARTPKKPKKGVLVTSGFWEIERIVGMRLGGDGKPQFRVRWKSCTFKDDTWEPTDNLCSSALEEAEMIDKAFDDGAVEEQAANAKATANALVNTGTSPDRVRKRAASKSVGGGHPRKRAASKSVLKTVDWRNAMLKDTAPTTDATEGTPVKPEAEHVAPTATTDTTAADAKEKTPAVVVEDKEDEIMVEKAVVKEDGAAAAPVTAATNAAAVLSKVIVTSDVVAKVEGDTTTTKTIAVVEAK